MGEAFTIEVSSSLARHLLSDGEPVKRKTRKPKQKTTQEPTQGEGLDRIQPFDDLKKLEVPPSGGWPIQPPFYLPTVTPVPKNPEVDSIYAVLKESEKVLEKLQKQEENMLQEVTERAKDLHDKEFKLPNRKPMPCANEKDACLNCYKEHNKDPLKCSQLVRDFADCARKARQLFGSQN